MVPWALLADGRSAVHCWQGLGPAHPLSQVRAARRMLGGPT